MTLFVLNYPNSAYFFVLSETDYVLEEAWRTADGTPLKETTQKSF